MKCILALDQSTQGSKGYLIGEDGKVFSEASLPHRQIIDSNGYISHDAEEIYRNILKLPQILIEKSKADKSDIVGVGLTNQRETSVMFNKKGPVALAVVWQCARGKEISDALLPSADLIYKKTGLPLSPYFPASKMAWLLKHSRPNENVMLGTIDSYLVYRLTGNFFTDFSNAARTQLFNIKSLRWDEELCDLFRIKETSLPLVKDSDDFFGFTDFNGFLPKAVPLLGVMGDSNASLYGQGCLKPGMMKVTYGTGSSIMMNTGDSAVLSKHHLSSSIAWKTRDQLVYAEEGNINYSASIVSWLKDDLGLIKSEKATSDLASKANPNDKTVFVPAFSGLSAPYWKAEARASLTNMTRLTGKNEIVRAALDSIVFQVQDVIAALESDSGHKPAVIYADGGASRNTYLMQRQADISDIGVRISESSDLSALGVSNLVASRLGFKSFAAGFVSYQPKIGKDKREEDLSNWHRAVQKVLE